MLWTAATVGPINTNTQPPLEIVCFVAVVACRTDRSTFPIQEVVVGSELIWVSVFKLHIDAFNSNFELLKSREGDFRRGRRISMVVETSSRDFSHSAPSI